MQKHFIRLSRLSTLNRRYFSSVQKSKLRLLFPNRRVYTLAITSATVGASLYFYFFTAKDKVYEKAESVVRFTRVLYTFVYISYLYKRLAFKYGGHKWDDPEYRKERREVHQKGADALLALCLRNGGSYVKAGQFLAAMTMVLPQEYTTTLSVLQDKAPFHSFEETLKVIQEQFGVPPGELFTHIEMNPIASASLAQVHIACTKDTNEKVAVKIQHPRIVELFEHDLWTMSVFVRAAEIIDGFTLGWVLPEFREMLTAELDFINEACNNERLRLLFKDSPQIVTPKVYWDKTSQRVLTMEYIDGCKINDVEKLKEWNFSLKEVAQLLVESYSKQSFIYGFIHSDPHPGNLFIRYNKELKKPQLVFLDHGCYKILDEETRLDYANLWKACCFQDHDNMKYYTKKFGIDDHYYRVLGLILTFTSFFEKSSSGLISSQRTMTKEEAKRLQKQVFEFFKLKPGEVDLFDQIQKMFANTKRDLLLLLRTNVLIHSITKELGRPVNRFEIMANYCIKALHTRVERIPYIINNISNKYLSRTIEVEKLTGCETLKEKFFLYWELFRLKSHLYYLKFIAWWYYLFGNFTFAK